MRIYLDNCCFNRPYDNQDQIRIQLESEAKLVIQSRIMEKEIELVWSYIVDYENQLNPFEERRNAINKWQERAILNITETNEIILTAKHLVTKNVKSKDALHVACAIAGKCNYFLTTDDEILKKLTDLEEINVINPLTFISILEKS